jgi:hypothetical protein
MKKLGVFAFGLLVIFIIWKTNTIADKTDNGYQSLKPQTGLSGRSLNESTASDQSNQVNDQKVTQDKRIPAALPPATNATALEKTLPIDEFKAARTKFLEFKSKYPEMERLWSNTKFLGETEDAEVARMWITMGLVVSPNKEESTLLFSLQDLVKENSSAILLNLNSNFDAIQSDPFIESVALSLAFQLDLTPEKRATFFEKVLGREFEAKQTGEVSYSSANMTNALIYLKQSGANPQQLVGVFQRSLAMAKDPFARQELTARINTYFPEVVLY